MKIMITGASGQVGWELVRSLAPIGALTALDREACDLSRPEDLRALVQRVSPDVIVNAAAYTAVDLAEADEHTATLVNGTAVDVLAQESNRAGSLLIHYSTDYVFDGAKQEPYVETDIPSPVNAYGRSKLVGEQAIRRAAGAYIILRTSWIYAARGRNFLRTILRLAGERDELRIVADQLGAPTWARSIAGATAAILRCIVEQRSTGPFASGLFHLTASGATSWYGFAQAVLEEASTRSLIPAKQLPQLYAISTQEYPTPAARPKNSRLSNAALVSRFGIALSDWREDLSACLKEMQACSSP